MDAAPLTTNSDADAYFLVTANGASTKYCTHIKRVRSKKDDYTPPGLDQGAYTQFAYRLTVETRQRAC